MNEQEISSLRIRLEEIYSLADRNLSQNKEDMIVNDIRDMSFDFVSKKIKALKQVIISGQKFDTPLVYRYLGIKEKKQETKPIGCNKCEDGYIVVIVNKFNINYEFAFACSCDLGKFRHRIENMKFYNNELLTENFKLKYGIEDVKENEIKVAKRFILEKC